MRRLIAALTVVVLCLTVVGSAWGEVKYTVTALGDVRWQPRDINNSGQVVGNDGNAAGTRALFYSGGVLTDIGTLGGPYGTATCINDSGQVAGYAMNAANVDQAFLYSGGVMTDLSTVGVTHSYGYGINSSGQVVGYFVNPAGEGRIFVYSGGAMTEVGPLAGQRGEAYDINDSGQIVGNTGLSSIRAFLCSGSDVTDLGPGYAYAINNGGQVVGYKGHAFLYSGGVITDLGTLGSSYTSSGARDINVHGQIVGDSTNPGSPTVVHVTHAFLYSDGVMRDLNSLIDPSSGWMLEYATAINDNGQIVGTGFNGPYNPRAFLLTPVPEPSTFVLLGVGTIGLLAFAWRRWKRV